MLKRLLALLAALALVATPVVAPAQVLRTPDGIPVNGNNPLPVYTANPEPQATIAVTPLSKTGTLFTIDTLGFDYVAFQATGTWVGTIVFEASNDNATWFSQSVVATTGSISTTATSNSLVVIPANHRYVRARVSAYTSGTIGATAWMRKGPNQGAQPVTVTNTAVSVGGQNSHSSASIGSPIISGCGVATAVDTTLVAGDTSRLFCTTAGGLVQWPYAVPDVSWQHAAPASGLVNTTTAVTMKAASAAGVRNYITSCQLAHDALSAATELVIRDGAAGTVIWRTKLQTPALTTTDIDFPTPLRGTAATLLEYATLTAVTGGVYLNCTGVTAP